MLCSCCMFVFVDLTLMVCWVYIRATDNEKCLSTMQKEITVYQRVFIKKLSWLLWFIKFPMLML